MLPTSGNAVWCCWQAASLRAGQPCAGWTRAGATGVWLGYHLLTELCRQAEAAGYWTLQSTVLQDNAASRALHTKCGFRLVGRRERIARDCHGRWLDTYLMEYRAAADEPVGYKKL